MDAKHQIMKAAIQLIAQKGFAATSTREIAMMASVNLAMINYYFKSKERLLDSILQEGTQGITKKTQAILHGSQNEIGKIFALIDIHIKYVFEQHEITKIFFQEELIKNNPSVQRLRQMDYQSFEKIIKAGQRQGAFLENINPILLYSTIVGTIQQFLVKHFSQNLLPDNDGLPMQFSKQAEELSSYLKTLSSKMLLK